MLEHESLGYLVARAHKSLNMLLMVILRDFDLTARQYSMLRRLHQEDGLPVRELVEMLFSDSSTIVASVDSLEAKGLLRRDRDPEDRRMKRLFLTKKAKVLVPKLFSRADDLLARMRGVLTTKERKALESGLTKLHRFAVMTRENNDHV